MDIGDIHLYVRRWQAVEEIELEELRSSTVEQNWVRMKAIWQLADRLGLFKGDDENEQPQNRSNAKFPDNQECCRKLDRHV